MVGGTHGYVGIAVVGAPSRYRQEMPYPKRLSEAGVCEVMCRQYEGHVAESHVVVIAADEEMSLFISGDTSGGVAMWKQRKRTGLAMIGLLRGRSLGGHKISAICITPDKTHVIIGTARKLLLLGKIFSALA